MVKLRSIECLVIFVVRYTCESFSRFLRDESTDEGEDKRGL